MPVSWSGGEPKVEIRHLGFLCYRVMYGPQILGDRATFFGARRLAKKARSRVASRREQQ